jgi:toxin HigB-1
MKKTSSQSTLSQTLVTYQIQFTDEYKKRAKRFLRKHPDLGPAYLKTLTLLEANPFHPSLRLHPLKGKMTGLHTVSINLSYRITMEFLIIDKQITPIKVGYHDAVY